MSSQPSENYKSIMRFVRIITSSVGVDAYDPTYRFNIVTGITTTSIIIYFCFTIATVLKEAKENWMFVIEAFVMSGSVFQGINKMCVGVLCARQVSALFQQTTKMYQDFEKKADPRYSQALLSSCHRLRRVLLVVGISYAIGVVGMTGTALAASFVTGKLHLIMHFHLPGLDVHTKLGTWMTQATHALCVVIGGLGMYAGDMLIIVNLLQSFVYADMLRLKVDELNKHAEKTQGVSFQGETTYLLVDIARWHQIYSRFIVQCNRMFYVLVSVQIATSAVCIVITIFALLTSDWVGGYCYICVVVPNMYLYCILGTMLENCNDSVMYDIYNISFYDLNAQQQRFVLFMLAKSQQPEMIRLLGVMPLSVSSALQITKSIYSITMMMIKFVLK